MEGEQAASAYSAWMERGGPSRSDGGSFRLLPLLAKNLERLGVKKDDRASVIQDSYRQTWCRNQQLFGQLAQTLSTLERAGIRTMVLKGVALSLLHYRDVGVRPMSDVDVLVPAQSASEAIVCLRTAGWSSKLTPLEGFQSQGLLSSLGWTPQPRGASQFSRCFMGVRHGHSFEKAKRMHLDLHWRVSERVFDAGADEDFWRRAVPLEVAGVPTLAMDATDQLVHVIVHGVRWNILPPLRWIADAAAILGNRQVAIDWTRLVALARKRGAELPLQLGLDYLKRLLALDIPGPTLEALRTSSVSLAARLDLHLRTRQPGLLLGLSELVYLAQRYRAMAGAPEYPEAARGPLAFLQHVLGAEHLWQVGIYTLFEGARRSHQALTRRQC